jgi:hypothetical protein
MASQHQQSARPALHVSSTLAQSSAQKKLSRQNSHTSAGDSPVPQPDEAVLRPEDEKEKAELDRDEERRSMFQKLSNEILHVPSGYRKVEVLIIRWHESIDDFEGHNNEVCLLSGACRISGCCCSLCTRLRDCKIFSKMNTVSIARLLQSKMIEIHK